jgi:hypothetical protein
MTIRRGQQWGDLGPVPAGAVRARSDAEVARIVRAARERGEMPPAVVLLGGDLMRAVGGTGDEARLEGDVARLPVDVVRVDAGGERAWFAAHLLARRSWWRGEVVAAMNAQHRGAWDVAPRGHPNDGRIDIVRVLPGMSLRDRWRARSRVVHGGHLPHPDIEVRTVANASIELARPARLWLDGEPWLTARELDLHVEPDALVVCV